MFLCESEIIREGGKWFINSLLVKNDEKDITGYRLERRKKNLSSIYKSIWFKHNSFV